MIKLIVTDVDGTLVEDGFTNVDPRLFDTILKLRKKESSLQLPAEDPGPVWNVPLIL